MPSISHAKHVPISSDVLAVKQSMTHTNDVITVTHTHIIYKNLNVVHAC